MFKRGFLRQSDTQGYGIGTGSATQTVSQHLRDAQVAETAAVVAEKGREVTKKSWNFLKGAYATVASQVEQVARENGYKVDLGMISNCCSFHVPPHLTPLPSPPFPWIEWFSMH